MIVICPDCKKTLIEFDVGSGNYHCSNPSCNFQYIEIMTGRQHRKNSTVETDVGETDNLDKKPKRILVGLAIESTLLNMGHSIFDKVTTKLREDYDASVFDCLESPQYLKKILEKNFDRSVSEVAVKSIKTVLGEFAYYESVREFLDELAAKN
ncbi:MAG TPA: hypothetical protein VJ792_00995 [Candidatus Nitrosotalea sp.]|nr:hypothetical protein [Candidatus Nitrosotalea sp.]